VWWWISGWSKKFLQEVPLLAAKHIEKFELMTPWVFLTFQGKIRVFWGYIWYFGGI
jgi:hypothetical protein